LIYNVKFYIEETELEIVRHYKYLGIMLSLNGSFAQALLDLTRRGQKAFFKLDLNKEILIKPKSYPRF
jgi:hypothetical protein